MEALRRGMWKITVEVVADQQGTIDMFLGVGLRRRRRCCATSSRCRAARSQDVVVLSHFADEAGQDALLAAPDEARG